MLEASQCRALFRRGCGVEGVNLHNPAKTIGFVGFLDVVKARLMRFPLECASLGSNAVALLLWAAQILPRRCAKVVVEVFFASEVSAPRRKSIAAVVEGALCTRARGVCLGTQQCIACGRAGQLHIGLRSNAAVVTAAGHYVPCAIAVAAYVHDRHAMRIHGFAHMLGRPLLARLLAFMAKQPSVGTTFLVHRAVFVVDHQQAFVVLAIQGKKVQPVVVVAHLQCLCSSIFTAVALEGW